MTAFEAQVVMNAEVRRLGRCCWPKHTEVHNKGHELVEGTCLATGCIHDP